MREKIETLFAEKIISGQTIYGGFSASANFIIEFASGRKIFAKGSHPQEMAHGTQHLRQEVAAYDFCEGLKKLSPAYLGMAGDGDEDGWLLGFWEYIEARNDIPLESIIGALIEFQSFPVAALKSARDQNYISLFLNEDKKWKRIASDKAVATKFLSLLDDGGASWLSRNIATLEKIQQEPLIGREGLLHGDLRIDNFLYDGKRTYVIDWPNACHGPLVFDTLFLVANLEALGICTIEEALSIYEAGGGTAFSKNEKTVMAVRISGFFADQAYRASPHRLPRLRWMQKGILFTLLGYLVRLGIIDSSPRPF